MCCVLSCFLKWLLGILNFIIMLIGLAIAALGAIIQALGASVAYSFFQQSIMGILKTIRVVDPKTFGTEFDLRTLMNDAGTILIVVGLAIACVSFLGYCGTGCSIRILLIVYTVVLAVIIVAQIIIVIVVFTSMLESYVKKPAKDSLDNYVEIDDGNTTSVIWNVVMLNLHCCGFDGYTDFYDRKNWQQSRTLTINGVQTKVTLVTPVACCVTTGQFPNVALVDDSCAIFPNAMPDGINLDTTLSNGYKGCYQVASDRYKAPAVLLMSAAIVIQFIVMIVCIVVLRIDKGKTDPV